MNCILGLFILALCLVQLATGNGMLETDTNIPNESKTLVRETRQNKAYVGCDNNQYECLSGRCISKNWKCDIVIDCEDGDDEDNCPLSSKVTLPATTRAQDMLQTTSTTEAPSSTVTSTGTSTAKEVIKIIWKCNSTARVPESSACPSNNIQCENGVCIPLSWKCDGKNDCINGEDEAFCSLISELVICGKDKFKCVSGRCIGLRWRCDGTSDCEDGDDEMNCDIGGCGSNWFQCFQGRCIRLSWRCDGKKDCEDGDDEKNCDIGGCASNMFPCFSGRCIPRSWKCDGTPDCADGDDEKKCYEKCDRKNNYCKGNNIPMQVYGSEELKLYSTRMNNALRNTSLKLQQVRMLLKHMKLNMSKNVVNSSFLQTALRKIQKHLMEQTVNLTILISQNMGSTKETLISPVISPMRPEAVTSTQTPATLQNVILKLMNLEKSTQLLPSVPARPDDSSSSCPAGFSRLQDNCYYFSYQKGSFSDACYICEMWGSSLLTIDSQKEDLSINIGVSGSKSFWTGGNDILKEGEFIWRATGLPFSYTNWATQRPNQLYAGNCVSISIQTSNSTYGWEDQKCASSSSNWVCEKNMSTMKQDNFKTLDKMKSMTLQEFNMALKWHQETLRLLTPSIAVDASTSCTIGFVRSREKCYFISYDEVSWYMAKYLCHEWRAELLAIENAQKQNYVEELLKGKEAVSFWTGGHGLFLQNKFIWDKTKQPFQYTNWSPRQFNSAPLNPKNCVYLTHNWNIERQLTTRPWYDGTCNNRYKFICEKNVAA